LEQLLAVAGGVITADDVNTLLGIAPAERLSQLVEHLVDRNAAAALAELDSTLAGGVEVGLLLDQLVGYFRDVMAAGVGCSGELMLYALPSQSEAVAGVANRLGVHTVLAVLQILDQSAARMRVSMHSRTLVEMAVVRICNLEDLDDLAALVAELRDGDDQALPSVRRPAARNTAGPSAPPQVAPPPVAVETVAQIGAAAEERVAAESPPSIVSELSPGEARKLWEKITSEVGGLVSEYGTMTDDVSATPQGELVVRFGQQGAMAGAHCQRPDLQRQLQRVAEGLCGPGVSLRFEMPHASQPSGAVAPPAPRATKRQLEAEVAEQPFVKKALTLFDVQQGQFQFTAGDDDRPPT
jgi:DNA polymerase-3 subunit gamma/tau